ncbi:MAG: hypothetical protein EOP23_20135 [Hyphomicrobiales bacterium]|nr:MAG: hypothetical protein EOP23_20135 [Hyphomicrobiales bacterium]
MNRAAALGVASQVPFKALDKRPAECFDDVELKCGMLDQIGSGTLESGRGDISLFSQGDNAALEGRLGGIKNAGLNRLIDILKCFLGVGRLLLQLSDAPTDRFLF